MVVRIEKYNRSKIGIKLALGSLVYQQREANLSFIEAEYKMLFLLSIYNYYIVSVIFILIIWSPCEFTFYFPCGSS